MRTRKFNSGLGGDGNVAGAEEEDLTQSAQRKSAEVTEKRRAALWGSEKNEADRAWDAFGDRDLRECASFWVDAEDNDGIGVLVFGEKELASGVDGEVARLLAAGGVVAGAFEFARRWIDGEHGDGIVAAIGGKEPFARWMESDFGSVVVARKSHGERRDCLECGGDIVVEADEMDCCHRGLDLAQHVHFTTFRGEHDVARSGAWGQLCR